MQSSLIGNKCSILIKLWHFNWRGGPNREKSLGLHALTIEKVNIYSTLISCQALIIRDIRSANICSAKEAKGTYQRRCIPNKPVITMQTHISLFDMLARHIADDPFSLRSGANIFRARVRPALCINGATP
ncbi:hypothetical protein TNCV_2187661 [Trichonephila clavipes]|nr:hypothetical protein TNCV_2187661 [Trichonephila clavipes]